jgi:hypothetical protein
MKFKIKSQIIDGEKWIKFDKAYDEKRYFYGNLIMLSLSILVILFMVWLTYYTLTHVDELTKNPLVYGLAQLDVETYCTCTVLEGNYADFWVNSTHIGVLEQYRGIDQRFLNFSPNMLEILEINTNSNGNQGVSKDEERSKNSS